MPRFSVITPTHNPKWLRETWNSLQAQTFTDWEWVISVNHKYGHKGAINNLHKTVRDIVGDDVRVTVVQDSTPYTGVGQRKHFAFHEGQGDILVELDHDDLLTANALERLDVAFNLDPAFGFVYSDTVDFPDPSNKNQKVTYHDEMCRAGWMQNGWRFFSKNVVWPLEKESRPCFGAVRFPDSALSISLIFYAPNHVRAWRASVYRELGGHDVSQNLADDHELVIRTYLATKMCHIAEPLYFYRVSEENTWEASVGEIRKLTYELQSRYLEKLVLREAELLGMPVYDLGGGLNPRSGWTPVDVHVPEKITTPYVVADLTQRWPFEDNSVAAFRAADLLEHLPNKEHTMAEIHRCLRPGGWLLSSTPSTDGRGAWMDPTHVSFWNSNAFWYWTRRDQARFIRNTDIRFLEVNLSNGFPTKWHEEHNIVYVVANLVALKDGYHGPGVVRI